MELTEFLLARIAEDEARFRTSGGEGTSGDMNADYIETLHERLLAECEAKRRILAEHPRDGSMLLVGYEECGTCADGVPLDVDGQPVRKDWPCPTIKALALPYADHPDYQDEWRP